MAAASRRADPSLSELLFDEAYRFDFFQAVRLLERIRPTADRVGRTGLPDREVVRFRSHVSLSFPPSAIHEIALPQREGAPAEMTVAFMGLTGPLGVLPNHYTEQLLDGIRRKDWVLRDFLDLFNHRLISLFFRTIEKYRFPVAWESSRAHGEANDGFTEQLFDLIGMGTRGLRGRLLVKDEGLVFYAGLLAQHPRSASALAGILTDFFAVPAAVEQLTGEWLSLAEEVRSRLGGASGANNSLGVDTIAGDRVWDQQAKLRLRLGPLTLEEYDRFLPSGADLARLVELARYFVNNELEFDVQLVLRADEVPGIRLGEGGDLAPRVGWSTWLTTGRLTRDAGDAVFEARSVRANQQSS